MTARELLLIPEPRPLRYSEWSQRLPGTLPYEFHLEEPGVRVTPREKTRCANLHENGYGYYCSWKLYLAARSSVPMGFSLKAWAEPSKQLCDNLC